jgi:pimeloyl-ACP methyl ester carboxylesterase
MAVRPDSTPLLSKIKVPTLVLTGADDTIIPPAEARKMASAIAGATVVEIPHASHLPNLERPSAFNDAVRSFLKELPALA